MGYNNGVGRQAPSFTLPGAGGGEVDLADYRGDWFPVLVFVSARNPGIEQELAGLSSAAGTFWGLRGQLVGICDASPDEATALAGRAAGLTTSTGLDRSARVQGLAFPLLIDDGRVAAAYDAVKRGGGIRTTVVILDRAGKIVWRDQGRGALRPAVLLEAFRQVVR